MGAQFQVDVNVVTHAEQVDALEKRLNALQSKGVDLKVKVDGLDKLDTTKIGKQFTAAGKQMSQNFSRGLTTSSTKSKTNINNVVNFARLKQQADKEVANLSRTIQNGLGIDKKQSDKIAKQYANTIQKSTASAQKQQQRVQQQYQKQLQQDAKRNLTQQLSNIEKLNKNKAGIITARANGKSETVEALRAERKQIKAEQKQLQKEAQKINKASGYSISGFSSQERAKAINDKQLATKNLVDKAWASVNDKNSEIITKRFDSELSKAKKNLQSSLSKYDYADADKIKESQKLIASMGNMKASDYEKPLEKIAQVTKQTQELGKSLQNTHKVNLDGINREIKAEEQNIAQTRKSEQSRTQSQVQQKISQLGYDNRLKNAHNQEIMDRIQQTRQKYESQQSQLAKIQQRATSGEFEARTAKNNSWIDKYAGQNSESLAKARSQIEKINALQKELQTGKYGSGDKKGMTIVTDDQIAKAKELDRTCQELKNTMTQVANEESKTLGYGVAERSANNVATYMENNTKALKKYGNALAELQAQYRSATTEMEKSKLDSKFATLKSQISAEGLTGNSIWTELSRGFKQIGQFAMTYGMIQSTVMQIPRKMVSAVKDVDSAMTDLYKVTDETDQRYQQFLGNAGNTSRDLGRNMSSYITQTANWAKLGYTLDESEQLAKKSSIYSNVGEVSDDTAVSDMVTAMKAFNIEAKDSEKIINSYNKLGNEFAVTSADIGEGISNSASSLATAGNDFDQSVAMLTGMSEITQSASEAGNALKIVSMRLRGYDEETQSYTNDVEELSGQVADLTKTAETPGGISLFTDDTKQTYKDTYTLMEDISKVYDKLTDKDQAALLETIAGKNRGNQIAALIQAFQSGQVQKAYEASLNSENSAQEEQDRWMESIEAKQQKFASQFQQFSNDFISSDLVKGVVDSGTGVLGFLDTAVQKFGALQTLVGGVALAKGIKSIV